MTPNDPLFNQQWYLKNTGQSGGTAGMDIDVTAAWATATGRGVKIVVNDTGIDYTNPDIAPNYDAADSKSVDAPTNDAYPHNTDNLSGTALEDLAHGTAVAGLIAAAGNDNYGIIGVAYGASVAAFRVLSTAAEAASPFAAIAQAFTNSKNFDVANNSWEETVGLADSVFSSDPNVQSAISALLDAATNGRHGLGTINVFAAGNGFQTGDDTNFHAFQSSINVVSVAALDANGTVNAPSLLGGRYSNTGATILVSAPGTNIVSDDIVGAGGFSSGDQASNLNGTSFAAPLATGTIALMLQVNPNLGLRDVQEILAYTARQTDSSNASWLINDATNWNGGGLHVSDDYGFGLVDARAAVALAQSWTLQHTLSNRTIDSVALPAGGTVAPGGTFFDFSVPTSDLLNLQWVRVQVGLEFQTLDDLKIVLYSPDGTQSVLLNHPYSGSSSGQQIFNTSVQLSTDQFWGEQSTGTWRLWIGDANPSGFDTGFLSSANLVLVGDQPTVNHAYIYTDEYATALAANPSRGILTDAGGGADTIDIAATSGNCTLNLTAGTRCTIDGAALTIGQSTILKTAIGGSGTDTLIANNLGDVLQAGTGNTTLIGGAGNDTLIGGIGNDTFSGGAGNNTITGGGGHDTLVLQGNRSAYTLQSDGHGGVSLIDSVASRDGTDDAQGLNYLQFADANVVVATAEQASVALLYIAAFNRMPDVPGLNGWEDVYTNGVSTSAKAQGAYVSLAETIPTGLTASIAAGFTHSTEFQQKYGSLTDTAFVTLLYQNVLGRAPDTPGLNSWLDLMHNGNATGLHYTREMVLVGFAESNENVAKAAAAGWLFQV